MTSPDHREARILRAATELLLRLGYRRVTVEDVATRAGVGKGTVYLHWSSREALFRAVLEQEVRAAVGGLLGALRAQPDTWRPHRLAHAYFLQIVGRPLLAALALGDAELLGTLTPPEDGAGRSDHVIVGTAYFDRLRECGVLRADLEPAVVAFAFAAVLEGFLRARADAVPTGDDGHDGGTDGDPRADLLAVVVRNALETPAVLDPAEEAVVRDDVLRILATITDGDREERLSPGRRLRGPRAVRGRVPLGAQRPGHRRAHPAHQGP